MSRLTGCEQLEEFDKAKANGFRFIFGIDEAGRGPLAGPVVAAAVCLKSTDFTCRVGDSKKLSPRQREAAFHEILDRAQVGVGFMNEGVIDRVNILNATHLAMTAAVRSLCVRMELEPFNQTSACKLLIDGNSYRGTLPFAVETVVGGDGVSLSVACASIVAKVCRDRVMVMYERLYPGYGFAEHKGYPTAAHRSAVSLKGFSPIHRRTFQSV